MTTNKVTAKYIFKILIVGDSGVGKSTLMYRFVNGNLYLGLPHTSGLDFGSKIVNIDGVAIKLQMLDAAGGNRFRSIVAEYYKNVHGVMIVFDLSSHITFENVVSWMSEISKKVNLTDMPIVLVGNKSDLSKQVLEEEIDLIKEKYSLPYMEVSVKN